VYRLGIDEAELEHRIITRGEQLLSRARARAGAGSSGRWLDKLLDRIMEDETFRVQALRFVDVLPMLDDDADLIRHLREYFGEEGLPLTGLIRFGMRASRGGIPNTLVARSVRKAIEQLAGRFMGGADSHRALETAARLRKARTGFSLDLLGEAVVSEAEAERYQRRYLELLQALPGALESWPRLAHLDHAHGREQPLLNLSIKLSSLYSQFNPLAPEASADAIARRLRPLLLAAREAGAFICIDMESWRHKDIILACLRGLLMEDGLREWPDVGVAMQAYLRDTEEDLRGLIDWAATRGTPITVRLVRGAYWDQEVILARQQGWPPPVWRHKWQTDACYERCLRLLLSSHPRVETAVATHNVRSIAVATVLAEAYGLAPSQYELQMLYGMAPDMQAVLAGSDYRLRVYVPFGELLPGMAYLVRRLLENSSSQSFQRMHAQRHLSPAQLLATPHGRDDDAGGADETIPQGYDERLATPFSNQPRHRFIAAREREDFSAALRALRSGLGGDYPLYIAGRSRDGDGMLESRNPAMPTELIGRLVRAGRDDADRAVEAAAEAFPEWSARPVRERAILLLRLADSLRDARDQFAALEVLEAGKGWREADADVTEAIDFLEYYAREACRLDRVRGMQAPGEDNRLRWRGLGVGVVIPPWNFPLAILTGMTAAALVSGNCVLLKPSSQTPVIAAHLLRLAADCDIPAPVLQLLPGPGEVLGDHLTAHAGVSFIAFTGSLAVGRRILARAAEVVPGQRHIKRVIAEMGGKNAIIIDSDADHDEAVPGVLQSAFGYQGQKCSACSRVVIIGGHYQRFLGRLVEAADSLRIAPPEDPASAIGPVISASARARIETIIASGRQRHDCVLARPHGMQQGHYVGPVIFSGVDPGDPLAREEIFGPVLALIPARDLEQALRIANDSDYALTAGLYSRSPAHIERFREAVEAGNLYINRPITGALVGRQPFGGYKLSGAGFKAGGSHYLLQFMTPVCITENTLRRGFAPDIEAPPR